jgi:hypothetical protein
VFPGERVWVTGTDANDNGGMWLYVAGILNPDVLSPDVDSSVLVGYPFAEQYLSFNGSPTTIYVKAADSQANAVYNLLGNQANPENPSGVQVSQPSNALVAQSNHVRNQLCPPYVRESRAVWLPQAEEQGAERALGVGLAELRRQIARAGTSL